MATEKEKKTALVGSIAKWAGIVAGINPDNGTDNCPLCELFFNNGCRGCPVSEKTGQRVCEGTPYKKWVDLTTNFATNSKYHQRTRLLNPSKGPNHRKAHRAAKAELKFLTDLL